MSDTSDSLVARPAAAAHCSKLAPSQTETCMHRGRYAIYLRFTFRRQRNSFRDRWSLLESRHAPAKAVGAPMSGRDRQKLYCDRYRSTGSLKKLMYLKNSKLKINAKTEEYTWWMVSPAPATRTSWHTKREREKWQGLCKRYQEPNIAATLPTAVLRFESPPLQTI